MKHFIKLIFFLILISCEDKDIIIRKSKENNSCINISREAHGSYRDFFLRNGVSPPENKDSIINKENSENFKKTESFELYNQSETKVYLVTVQIKKAEKVRYEKYLIEPTQNIELGCNYDFELYNHKLINFKKIEYRIHKIEIDSEY